jgi:hypothetical protein
MTWFGVAFVSKSNSNRVRTARTYQDAPQVAVIKLPLYRLAPIVSLVAVGLTMDTASREVSSNPAGVLDAGPSMPVRNQRRFPSITSWWSRPARAHRQPYR